MQSAVAAVMFLITWHYRGAWMANRDISKMIRKLRTTLGLTQEQFAAKAGVTYSTVNRWENGKAKPSPLALQKIEELQNKLKQNKQSK